MQKLKEFFQANYKKPAFWIIGVLVVIAGVILYKNYKKNKKR